MPKIERFEDIEGWQLARELTRMVYDATKGEKFSRDFGLKDQIQRLEKGSGTNSQMAQRVLRTIGS